MDWLGVFKVYFEVKGHHCQFIVLARSVNEALAKAQTQNDNWADTIRIEFMGAVDIK